MKITIKKHGKWYVYKVLGPKDRVMAQSDQHPDKQTCMASLQVFNASFSSPLPIIDLTK